MKTTAYLYEGLDRNSKRSMMLWESAGYAITEAQLTAKQITQLFQKIEQGATAAGSNRTAIGQTKDAASAVAKAYQDLKTKVADSAIMQNFDQQYDKAAAKLKQTTGGDQGAMRYVEKYRAFAKKHPIAQTLIYSALIAAAGISGAGAGGAAVIGLLKMTDKLLQGEKFSQAAIKGAETGALAYGAGQIGQAMQGDAATGGSDTTTTSSQIDQTSSGMQASWPTQGIVPPSILERFPPGQFQYMQSGDYWEVFDDAGNKMANFTVDSMNESQQLSNDQVTALFEHIIIAEGLWDQFKTKVIGEPEERASFAKDIKSGVKAAGAAAANTAGRAAGAIAQKAQTVGNNLTTTVTADKLNKAWKAAGSPTDSEAIKDILIAQGINAEVVDSSLQAFKVTPVDRSRLPDINKMNKAQLQQLLQALEAPTPSTTKTHTGGKVAGQVSQTPNAIQQRQARATKSATTQPPAAPAQQLPGDRNTSMAQLLKQRQAQGMTESIEYNQFKIKLRKALSK